MAAAIEAVVKRAHYISEMSQNVWKEGRWRGLARQSLEYLTPSIIFLRTCNGQCNKYILGTSFNLLFGVFLLNSAWLAPTLPQMPEGRYILYSIEQNVSLTAVTVCT